MEGGRGRGMCVGGVGEVKFDPVKGTAVRQVGCCCARREAGKTREREGRGHVRVAGRLASGDTKQKECYRWAAGGLLVGCCLWSGMGRCAERQGVSGAGTCLTLMLCFWLSCCALSTVG